MEYNDISNEQLGKIIENVLNGMPADMTINDDKYVDEKAEAFVKSLKDMVY